MMRRIPFIKNLFSLLFLFIASSPIFTNPVQAQDSRPYELVNTVNSWRATRELPAFIINSALMSSAQSHSEYQSSLGIWTHQGADGSFEIDRAIAAGYGGGTDIICDEAVAYAAVSQPVEYVVYDLWNDYDHRELVLLNSDYQHVGAGAAENNGLVYYTLDACSFSGASSNNATRPDSPPWIPTPSVSAEVIEEVLTTTPQEDGTITHIVEPGQALWSIAIAYGLQIADLVTNNQLSPSNPVIYVGEELLIQVSFTPTTSPTITQTSKPVTHTPKPSTTPRPTRPTSITEPTATTTTKPLLPALPTFKSFNYRTLGIGMIIFCGIGLLTVIIVNLRT